MRSFSVCTASSCASRIARQILPALVLLVERLDAAQREQVARLDGQHLFVLLDGLLDVVEVVAVDRRPSRAWRQARSRDPPPRACAARRRGTTPCDAGPRPASPTHRARGRCAPAPPATAGARRSDRAPGCSTPWPAPDGRAASRTARRAGRRRPSCPRRAWRRRACARAPGRPCPTGRSGGTGPPSGSWPRGACGSSCRTCW